MSFLGSMIVEISLFLHISYLILSRNQEDFLTAIKEPQGFCPYDQKSGGDGESRTRVQEYFRKTFSERIRVFGIRRSARHTTDLPATIL